MYDDQNVFTESEGATLNPSNQLYESAHNFVDQIAVRVYNKVGLHSYTLGIDRRDEHDKVRDRDNDQEYDNKIVMQILNKQCYDNRNWSYIIYLLGGTDQITGYYLLWADCYGSAYSLKHCAHPPEGHLEVLNVFTV